MYESFFQLEKTPFSTVPDPNCVHLVGQHADAISGLTYGVMCRKGYLLLTGEAGLGKTTAVVAMEQCLNDANVQLSMVLNPILTGPEFLEMVLLNFGFEQIPASKAQRLKMLQNFLIRSDQEGKISALVVDEAHKLSADLLEEIRLLGNLEASDHKLLQIVLVGQDELNERLNLPDLWQLKQRMVVRMSLRRLDRYESEQYLRFRWRKAGGSEDLPFTDEAIDTIAAWSLGIPRLINAICDNALLIAFSASTTTVDAALIREACGELQLRPPAKKGFRMPPAPNPFLPQGPIAVPVVRDAGPQFWQYSSPSIYSSPTVREKAAQFVADDRGGIPYTALVTNQPLDHRQRNVLIGIAVAAVVVLSVYLLQVRSTAGSSPGPAAVAESAPREPAHATAAEPQPTVPFTKAPVASSTPPAASPEPRPASTTSESAPAQFTVGGEEQQANLIEKVPLALPPLSGRVPIQGNVRLIAVIGTNGAVKNLKVIGGTPELIQPALDAVAQWRYRPLLVNGEPVEVVTEIDVDAPSGN